MTSLYIYLSESGSVAMTSLYIYLSESGPWRWPVYIFTCPSRVRGDDQFIYLPVWVGSVAMTSLYIYLSESGPWRWPVYIFTCLSRVRGDDQFIYLPVWVGSMAMTSLYIYLSRVGSVAMTSLYIYLSESGPWRAMTSLSLDRPPTGTRSLPVANCSTFLCSSSEKSCTISQKYLEKPYWIQINNHNKTAT